MLTLGTKEDIDFLISFTLRYIRKQIKRKGHYSNARRTPLPLESPAFWKWEAVDRNVLLWPAMFEVRTDTADV